MSQTDTEPNREVGSREVVSPAGRGGENPAMRRWAW